ncbi:MAG TPA: biotin/lipoyl-containing protein [Caldilineaceae bacterium]|nr:biotin/lipoyl-containing protein [Caldilineaceae bacterium]
MTQTTYLYRDHSHTVRLERQADGAYRAWVGDRAYPVQAQRVRPGQLRLEVGGATYDVYYGVSTAQGAPAADRRCFVAVVGRTSPDGRRRSVHYTFAVADTVAETGSAERQAQSTGPARGAGRLRGELEARMPGQVTQVLVREGEQVSAGQTLVVLSAMKMETRLLAPADGRVARVLVKEGETVERGQRLVELATDPA